MTIYNVLFKGVEIKATPFCKAFLTEQEADSYIVSKCKALNLTIRSSMGWDDSRTIDDRRTEDTDGNTYYFVIYKQELN